VLTFHVLIEIDGNKPESPRPRGDDRGARASAASFMGGGCIAILQTGGSELGGARGRFLRIMVAEFESCRRTLAEEP